MEELSQGCCPLLVRWITLLAHPLQHQSDLGALGVHVVQEGLGERAVFSVAIAGGLIGRGGEGDQQASRVRPGRRHAITDQESARQMPREITSERIVPA